MIASLHELSRVETDRGARVDRAIDRSVAWLRARQAADGHFDGVTWQSVAGTAQVVIVEAFLGVLTEADARGAIQLFEAHVREDGSFAAYQGATFGSLSDAAQVEAALACCGLDERAPLRRRIRSWVEARGGRGGVDPMAKVFLVLGGVLPASSLPSATVLHTLIPGVDRWMSQNLLAYYGAIFGYLLPGLIHGLTPRARRSRLGAVGSERIVRWLLERQNPDGNWAAGQWVTSMALACLSVNGVPTSHPAMQRGLLALESWKRRGSDGLSVMPFNADVWNTAMALRSLTAAEARWDAHPAVAYLLDAQSSGWSFSSGNPRLPDTDTTAIVLWALAGHGAPRDAVTRGERWLLAMQNEDGGWPAFTQGQRGKAAGPLFTRMPALPDGVRARVEYLARPPLELVDHATADLTGRVLGVLGALGHRAGASAPVDRGLRFLDAQREGDRWWGRWTTNYLASTAFILHGLRAAGASGRSLEAPLRWMASCQNEDGGFGERNESYANPGLAGRGPSNAYVTGLVAQALCLGGTAPVVERAIDHLCATQGADGAWSEVQAVQTLIPPELSYTNAVNFQTAPLEALAMWRRAAR